MREAANCISETYIKSLTFCNLELARRKMSTNTVAQLLGINYAPAYNLLKLKVINMHHLDTLMIALGMKVTAYIEDDK